MIDPFRRDSPVHDPAVLLLQALAWICAEPARAERLLDLTGLDAANLRERAMEPDVLNAVGDFLRAYDPDLIACAAALGVGPAVLAGAKL
jgi:adenine/guanine phosphoribosyltransferase-like PRPP-binding protein